MTDKDKELDIESMITGSNLTKEQMLALRDRLDGKISEDKIKNLRKPTKNKKITDINDEHVRLFDEGPNAKSNSIFSVYSSESNNEMVMAGRTVAKLFGRNDKQREKYAKKELGPIIQVGCYRIRFMYANYEYKD